MNPAQKLPGLRQLWFLQDLARPAPLQNSAILNITNLVSDLFSKPHLMGSQNHGHAFILQLFYSAQDLVYQNWIKGTGYLIQ